MYEVEPYSTPYSETKDYIHGQDNVKKLLDKEVIPSKEDFIEAMALDNTYDWTRYGVRDKWSGNLINDGGIMKMGIQQPDEFTMKLYSNIYDSNFNVKHMIKQIKSMDRKRIKLAKMISPRLDRASEDWFVKTEIPNHDDDKLETAWKVKKALDSSMEMYERINRINKWTKTI